MNWIRTAARLAPAVMPSPTPFETTYRWFTGSDGVTHQRDTCQYLNGIPSPFDASILVALDEPFCFSCFNTVHTVYLGTLPADLHRIVRAETVLAAAVPADAGIAELAQAAVYLQQERFALTDFGTGHGIDLRRGSPSILERYDAHTEQVLESTRARRWDSLELLRDWALDHPDGAGDHLLARLDDPASRTLTGVAVNERGLDPLQSIPLALVECWVQRRRYADSLSLLLAPAVVAEWLTSEARYLTSGVPLFPVEHVVATFDPALFDTPAGEALLDTALTLWDPFGNGAYLRFADALNAAQALHC